MLKKRQETPHVTPSIVDRDECLFLLWNHAYQKEKAQNSNARLRQEQESQNGAAESPQSAPAGRGTAVSGHEGGGAPPGLAEKPVEELTEMIRLRTIAFWLTLAGGLTVPDGPQDQRHGASAGERPAEPFRSHRKLVENLYEGLRRGFVEHWRTF